MAIYKTSNNELWDDMDGTALVYAHWPADAVEISEEEAEVIRNAQTEALLASLPELATEEKADNIGLLKTIQELEARLAALEGAK